MCGLIETSRRGKKDELCDGDNEFERPKSSALIIVYFVVFSFMVLCDIRGSVKGAGDVTRPITNVYTTNDFKLCFKLLSKFDNYSSFCINYDAIEEIVVWKHKIDD